MAPVAIAVLLLALGGGGGLEPCHVLCVNAPGRQEHATRDAVDPKRRWNLHVDVLSIVPTGNYADDGSFRRAPSGSSAIAFETLPTLSYRASDRVTVDGGWSLEVNHASHVVIPTMLPTTDASHTEVAPGRLWGAVHWKAPAPDDWPTTPWLGIGYAFSERDGTSDVRPNLATVPAVGIEALGIGSDDVYATAQLVSRSSGAWESSIGLETRVHMLPKWQHFFGVTTGYSVWVARRVGPAWTLGVETAGFETLLPGIGVEQRSMLNVAPMLVRQASPQLRVGLGTAFVAPGTTLNQNALQSGGPIASVDWTF